MTAPQPLLVVSNHGEIVGGGEISLLTLLKGLERSRWAPTVVVPGEGPVAAEVRALKLPTVCIPLPGLHRPGPAMMRSLAALRRLAAEKGARLIHANGSRAMFYAGLAGRLAGRPVIWHVRIADRDPWFDRFLAGLARIVIVNSRAVGARFAWAPPAKVRCIHNGVDLERFSPRNPPPDLRPSLGLPNAAPVVGSVGRFVPFKGYTHLLEAAERVAAVVPEAHWVLVGDGELRRDLEGQAFRLGIGDRIHFTGWRQDIPDLLALCNLFVLPSLGEHFGRVLIEAMAMAKAVIATRAGGVVEIVVDGETGLLVPPANPERLAEAVLVLLKDPVQANRLGKAGHRRATSEFSLAHHVEAVEALYEDLLGTRHERV